MKQIVGALLLSALLTGCSSSQRIAENTKASTTAVPAEEYQGTDGTLILIQSDNVMAAGYDLSSQVMSVQFKNGSLYEYFGVPLQLWESFLLAQPNPWSQVGYPQLVEARKAYRRVR
jgi:hypothetical protein